MFEIHVAPGTDAIDLGAARLLAELPERRATMARLLRDLADHVGAGDDPCHTLVVALVGGDRGPRVFYPDGITWDDIGIADIALGRAQRARYTSPALDHQKTPREHIDDWWEQRRFHDERVAIELAAYVKANPWQCESCPRRFATKRGAVQHERSCVYRVREEAGR
jgi:hypothetical protein